ncbi:Phospholipase/carboxylesterase, partial [mine drainage metagenome]
RDVLTALGHRVDWHSYPMAHAVLPQEIADLRAWLARTDGRLSMRVPRRALPDFCHGGELLALAVVALLVAVVMQLAPSADAHLRAWSLSLLFAAWLALLLGVTLCKSRPLLQRLPGAWPWAGAWLLSVLLVLVAASVVWRLDHALGTGLTAR